MRSPGGRLAWKDKRQGRPAGDFSVLAQAAKVLCRVLTDTSMERGASGLGRSILGKYPPSPRSGERRREFPHGFRARVMLLDTVRLRTAAPLTYDEKMSRGILVHQQLMRPITPETLHVRPDLSCETEPSDSAPGFNQVSRTMVTILAPVGGYPTNQFTPTPPPDPPPTFRRFPVWRVAIAAP